MFNARIADAKLVAWLNRGIRPATRRIAETAIIFFRLAVLAYCPL